MSVPEYVPGHGLLARKTVVVTAAAGTGIGCSSVTSISVASPNRLPNLEFPAFPAMSQTTQAFAPSLQPRSINSAASMCG
jgi:hypothetical protein